MKEPFKNAALSRLKKARGHLDHVMQMIEEDKYCIDILQQNLATAGHIKSANAMILESHLNTCGGKGLASSDPAKRDAFIKELVHVCTIATR